MNDKSHEKEKLQNKAPNHNDGGQHKTPKTLEKQKKLKSRIEGDLDGDGNLDFEEYSTLKKKKATKEYQNQKHVENLAKPRGQMAPGRDSSNN